VGIEQDIQQSYFRNNFQKAAVNLLFTSGWLRDRMKVLFDKEDITAQQFNILRILRGSFPTPLSTLQIRDRMLEKMSDTSRLVDRLVVKGLVKKITAETDRRLVDILITEKGKKLLSRIDAQETEMDAILNNLTEKEAEQLSELLDKMRSATG
jgi:MarR family transcriptional regulator, 2-MHQ and catechol-resistance regulon repressor